MPVPCKVGESSRFRKTVSESDVYLFAGISGDFAPNHIDEEFMRQAEGDGPAAAGGRIAHGALLVAYMSAASTRLYEPYWSDAASEVPVSAGYDRIRFLKPVHIGDTVTVTYRVSSVDADRGRHPGELVRVDGDDRLQDVAVAGLPGKSDVLVDGGKKSGDQLPHPDGIARFAVQRKLDIEDVSRLGLRTIRQFHDCGLTFRLMPRPTG